LAVYYVEYQIAANGIKTLINIQETIKKLIRFLKTETDDAKGDKTCEGMVFSLFSRKTSPNQSDFQAITPNQPIFKRSLRNAVVFCLRYEEFKFHGREKWWFNKTL
jgi:hypothetical protein